MTTIIHGLSNNGMFALGKSKEISKNIFRIREPEFGPILFQPVEKPVAEDGEEIILDDSDPAHAIINEVNTFMAAKSKYAKYKIAHKRGIILYGPPGTGKTIAVKLLSKLFVEKVNGWVITNAYDIDMANAYNVIRGQDLNRPIMFVFDDFKARNSQEFDALLRFMDGQEEVSNVVFLFTTNYFKDIPVPLLRPSRTDLHVEIKGMSEKAAVGYCLKKFNDHDFAEVKVAFADNGVSLTYAVLKEVMLLKHVYGLGPNDAILRIRNSGCNFMTETVVEQQPAKSKLFNKAFIGAKLNQPIYVETAATPAAYTSESDNS